MRKLAGFIIFLVVFNSFITEHVKAVESSGQSSRDVRSKWVKPMNTEENATPKTKDSEVVIGAEEEVKQYARSLRKKTIPEIEKDIASRNDRDENVLTDSLRVKRQLKRKPVRKLSNGPTLTDDDVKEMQTTLENFLIKEYKKCQTKSAKEVDKCITEALASTEKKFESILKDNNKCAGAELQKCKDQTWNKVLGYVPFALPVSNALAGVTAEKYGGHKIGFILAKNFDNCYDKNDKIDQFLKCFKSGNEKSPLNVARDKIAVLVGDFCKNEATDELQVECRGKVVGYIKQKLDTAAANILIIFCANKDKSPTCDNAKANFDIFSQYKTVPLSTFKTDKKYGEVDVGTEIGSAAEKCENQQSIDKFVDCLKGELDSGVIRKNIATKLAAHCKSVSSKEKNCRKEGKVAVETKLKEAISAVLENYCGGNYKKEKAYQSCLTKTGNKISADISLPAPTISFQKPTPLKSIVTKDLYGKITIGSIVEANLKGCLEKNKGKITDDFTSCLGSSQTDPLKTAMKEISNQLTNHCAKNQLRERICRKEGEEEVQGLIRNSIDSLILTFCEGESSKYKWQEDYDECQKTSKAKKLSGEFVLPFKLLDEIPLSQFMKGEIKIGEILKKEADSCKTTNSKSRDEYLNCLKGKPLATVKVDVAQQLANSCGKVGRSKVDDCRINGQTEVEKQLKDSLIAILMNFCREFNANPEDTYNECLNFDGDKLGVEAKLGNLPATVHAPIDVLRIITDKDDGEIKIGEILQTDTNACNDKKTSNEYYKCLKGDDGAQTSPLKTAIEKVKAILADVCGQKESIMECRDGEPLLNTMNKLKEATEAIFLNYCGLKAKNNQQEYTKCVDDGFKETLPYLNDKTLPISLRNEISLSSLVTTKYGNIPVGEILEGQTGKCKNIKALDEVVSYSTSAKFADYALEQNLVESDWNRGVEEMKKEFKQTIQAFLSNFCRGNVNKNQGEYSSCLTEGLKLSESLSQGYTPIDIFLQCSSKKTETEYNQCIDTVNGQRLNAWSIACSSDLTLIQECKDSATKMASETAQVAKVAAKLVGCVTPSCIKTERPKVIDEFVKADEKYCKTPCKDSKLKIEAAVKKGVSDCSADKTSSKCRADLLSAGNVSCKNLLHMDACEEVCAAAGKEESNDGWSFIKIAIVALSIVVIIFFILLLICWRCFSRKDFKRFCKNRFGRKDPSSEPLLKEETLPPPPPIPTPSASNTETNEKDKKEEENINNDNPKAQNDNPKENEKIEQGDEAVKGNARKLSATKPGKRERSKEYKDWNKTDHFKDGGYSQLPYMSDIPDPASVRRKSVTRLPRVFRDKSRDHFVKCGTGYDCVEKDVDFQKRRPGVLEKDDKERFPDEDSEADTAKPAERAPRSDSFVREDFVIPHRSDLHREASASKSRESSAEPRESSVNKPEKPRSSRSTARKTTSSSTPSSVPRKSGSKSKN
ncbi:hypothetical protein GCK72_015137 [Caenorhabditis remanei]|uniref:DUF19 domain-containing protein n=1 Tax=Caenorhabditis remanei TaxID=31234 RepID=A0A6A5GT71_CAERE|nr:hypothetical protein GCK72_015137 [Caenorhabditis remanei]KAF1758678.1 hypothetical protein GCK72_015137 [Caenorhabditis remanei]